MIAAIPSAVLLGVDARLVSVEVHVSNGLPGFTVVGLPDAAVRESRDRVRAAFLSSGLAWPRRRVTVNLAPSGIRKGGAGLDLPVALGVLVASGVLRADAVTDCGFVGELGLDGSLRGVPGTMVLAEALRNLRIVVPEDSAPEVSVIPGARYATAATLAALVARLRSRGPWPDRPATAPARAGLPDAGPDPYRGSEDLADVRGQRVARRALEVAAAGGHHLLMVGPPGSGKSMLANRLGGLLPDLDHPTALAASRIHSVAGRPLPPGGLLIRPPFRAPHHGVSPVAMIGGGATAMRPGEISLAHGGALFLDELGEFPVAVLDALRQPLEDGQVQVSRARGTTTFPARFQLVAAMNPCPCGEGGTPGSCRCSPTARARYARRLSGPLLDRFDLSLRVDPPQAGELVGAPTGEGTVVVAARVTAARTRASARGVRVNADLRASRLDELAPLSVGAARLLERHLRSGRLSARGLHRVHRLARTVADLDGGAETIDEQHLHEALILRGGREPLGAGAA